MNKKTKTKKVELGLAAFSTLILISMFFTSAKEETTKIASQDTVQESNKTTPQKVSKIKKQKKLVKQIRTSSTNKEKATQKTSIQKIVYLQSCLANEECDFPQTDPRSYYLAINKEISLEIKKNRLNWAKNWTKMNSDSQERIRDLFAMPDGFIKEQMLKFAKSLDKEAAKSFVPDVLDHIIDYHNAVLIPDAMDFLAANLTEENQENITFAITSNIIAGSPHVSNALSKNITKVLNASSSAAYSAALEKLPESSSERTHLDAALEEFSMQESGG